MVCDSVCYVWVVGCTCSVTSPSRVLYSFMQTAVFCLTQKATGYFKLLYLFRIKKAINQESGNSFVSERSIAM